MREPDAAAYDRARLAEALAGDRRVSELGLEVTITGADVYITGTVGASERRNAVTEIAERVLPGKRVHNEVEIAGPSGPPSVEELR